MKTRSWVIAALVLAYGIFWCVDALYYPLQGNLYSVIGVEKEKVTEIRIFHYRKIISVTDTKECAKLLDLLDAV